MLETITDSSVPAMKKGHYLSLVLLALLIPIALPFVVIAIIALEEVVFDTRYFSDSVEAIGLGWLLEALFNALGING